MLCVSVQVQEWCWDGVVKCLLFKFIGEIIIVCMVFQFGDVWYWLVVDLVFVVKYVVEVRGEVLWFWSFSEKLGLVCMYSSGKKFVFVVVVCLVQDCVIQCVWVVFEFVMGVYGIMVMEGCNFWEVIFGVYNIMLVEYQLLIGDVLQCVI